MVLSGLRYEHRAGVFPCWGELLASENCIKYPMRQAVVLLVYIFGPWSVYSSSPDRPSLLSVF
jgi:hypothetical protein